MKKRLQALGFGLQLELRHVPREILLGILRAYKYAISPLMLPACRYVPTCSEYAAEAIEKHGAIRGVLMGAWRLLRCHPFVKGGFDPVPNPVPGSSRSGRPGPLPRAWTPRAPHSEASH